jgi:membrane fusion protein, copper/silver efflux system
MRPFIVYTVLIMVFGACRDKQAVRDPEVYYTCSMDPQVISDKPGKCPICKMELTPVAKNSAKQSDNLELSDQQIQLGNIQTDTIRTGGIDNEIVLTGILNLDATKTTAVSARVMGRIEKMHVKNVGDYVSKGMPLYELYSEELNNAKQEYKLALQRRNLFTGQAVIDFEDIIESARNKLRLWGMTNNQILSLDDENQTPVTTTFYSNESGYVTAIDVTEGGYITEGGNIIQLADLTSLWAEAQIYATEISQVPRAGTASVEVPQVGLTIEGKIAFANPEISPDSRINLLRITIPNPGNKLKPGMPAYVVVRTGSRNSLLLPTDAIIRDSRGATVWVQSGANTFRSQMVSTGLENNGVIEITKGLQAGDVVVVTGAYLLHSEFILKHGADPMSGHNH